MRPFALPVFLLLFLAGTCGAQEGSFLREGDSRQRARKDPLEGKAPPALAVSGWMNTDGKALKLDDLKGKVVILDFWGVW